ncbi:MAG: hypothetical protein EOO61_02640 [Hymenobacter sp.]|nr:MAG: hypothetical protein EOO61_02640 [Hymenobacter sp.]
MLTTIIQLYEELSPLLSLPFFTDQITYAQATHIMCLNVSQINPRYNPTIDPWYKKWGKAAKKAYQLSPELYAEITCCGYGKDLWQKFNTDERIQRYLKLRALID